MASSLIAHAKILVIQTAFIGDVILATALIEKLHKHYPEAQIDVLVRKGNESLFSHHPYLNKVWVWDKKQQKYQNLIRLAKQIRQQHYDLVINLQRFAASGLLSLLSGAKQTIGFRKNPFSITYSKRYNHSISDGQHEVERNQHLITPITDDKHAMPRLYPNTADYQKADIPDGDFVCVAPASVWFTKQWPATKWVALIDALPAGAAILLVGAPADHALCEQIKTSSKHSAVENRAGQLSLLQSAALMSRAKMNYTNDSAPLHLASAVNAPTMAVFCSTVPSFGFGPLSDDGFVAETREPLACRPCGLHGKRACPEGHFSCSEIPIEPMAALLNS